jgi:hypothetical protein
VCLHMYIITCVFHLLYKVFYDISVCIICNIDGVSDILWRNILPSEKKKLA